MEKAKTYYCPNCKEELGQPVKKQNPMGFYWELKCINGHRIITDDVKNFDGLTSRIAGV